MKKLISITTILFISIVTFAQKIPQDQIVGFWQSEEFKIEIYKLGNTYAGKLLWSKDIFEEDGKTSKKDDKNPNEKLRVRPWQGLTHITGLKYNDKEFVDGKLYSVQNGNTYNIKGELKGDNVLETRVYLGVPIMGKTVKWSRVK